MGIFFPADILLPQNIPMEQWAVIACDQFTSEPDYWHRVSLNVGIAPSALHLILPEAELEQVSDSVIEKIHTKMREYCESNMFRELPASYIYVERETGDGTCRRGIIGMVDLEQYDYRPDAKPLIRATEETVLERIPPRKRIRENAVLEISHVLMLCDDAERSLVEPVTAIRDRLEKLYDFALMEGGGRIRGWLLTGDDCADFEKRMRAYCNRCAQKQRGITDMPALLAVGDGNHSLAAAKDCYEQRKAAHPGANLLDDPKRFVLVELENIHDPALRFEPIHRVLTGVDTRCLLRELGAICGQGGCKIPWIAGERRGGLVLDEANEMHAVAVLQDFLEDWLTRNPGKIDYIHGSGKLEALAKNEGSIGFLMPSIQKDRLFEEIITGGVLPKKAFSLGRACEKRYYLEGRKIK